MTAEINRPHCGDADDPHASAPNSAGEPWNRVDHSPEQTASESESSRDAHPSRRQKLLAGILAGTAFLVFYVLSSGPVAGIHRAVNFAGIRKPIEVVYAPVVFIVKRDIKPFSTPLKWYVDLFR